VKGHIQQRGKNSWRLKFDAGRDPANGKRQVQYVTVRGGKRAAQTKLAEMIAAVENGAYVEPSKITVAEFVRARVDQWEAAGTISARTAQRYRQLVEHQIVPHLGAKLLQKLRPLDIEAWHATLRTSGRVRGKDNLSSRTISHAHKVLGKALADAAGNELIHRNVARLKPPKLTDSGDEMVIVRDVPALLEKLEGSALRLPALLGLLCGLRLAEVLGLRWSRVDFDAKVIQVREVIEQTKAYGIRFKSPKSKAARRDITMPDEVIAALQAYRREQLELRLQLGLGRLPDDALLFWDVDDGGPRSMYTMSKAWGDFAARIGMPDVTFHALRHTHASQLIDAGVDIVAISRRLGHSKPDITLRIYAHLFKKDDSKAAAAINAALRR
jgi:integrase